VEFGADISPASADEQFLLRIGNEPGGEAGGLREVLKCFPQPVNVNQVLEGVSTVNKILSCCSFVFLSIMTLLLFAYTAQRISSPRNRGLYWLWTA